MIDFSPQDIQNLIALGREASDAIMEVYDSNTTQVEYKADNSPLTQADKAAHEIIVAGLARLFPEIPIVSEEGDLDAQRALLNAPALWFVDPIDGTKEFVGRTDEFCIGIGLVVDNRPAFGVVIAPTFDTVYYGGPRYGSFQIKGDAEPTAMHVQTLSPHIIGISRSHPTEATKQYIATHFPDAPLKVLGSMLKQVRIAAGEIDVFPCLGNNMNFWDLAAGHAIVEGAGGYVARPDGTAVDFRSPTFKTGDFIASAERFI